MSKLYKAHKGSDSCKISIHPLYLNQLGWKPGDDIKITVKGKKIILTKED